MSHKDELRKQRYDTVINKISSKQEKELTKAIRAVCDDLKAIFPGITLNYKKRAYLYEITSHIDDSFPDGDMFYYHKTSFMAPDGGFVYLVSKNFDRQLPILISEKKNQGTNDLRKIEGKPQQSQGNAIERLGKNVIGLRAFLADEDIFPFICFGDGCDFADGSSILDRAVAIAIFGELNKIYLHDVANLPQFKRGSFFFRDKEWTAEEMHKLCLDVAKRSVHYYFSKYGEETFI